MIVLDTHALLWWVTTSPQLSARARREIASAVRQGPVVASAISLLEIATASRRGRLRLGLPASEWFAQLDNIAELRIAPVDAGIARAAGLLGDGMPGDPIDRIIVATATALGAKLVTADLQLRRSTLVDTVW